MLHKMRAGFNDTELKLFAVTPTFLPARTAVMMVTPVGKLPSAFLNARGSIWGGYLSLVTGELCIGVFLRAADIVGTIYPWRASRCISWDAPGGFSSRPAQLLTRVAVVPHLRHLGHFAVLQPHDENVVRNYWSAGGWYRFIDTSVSPAEPSKRDNGLTLFISRNVDQFVMCVRQNFEKMRHRVAICFNCFHRLKRLSLNVEYSAVVAVMAALLPSFARLTDFKECHGSFGDSAHEVVLPVSDQMRESAYAAELEFAVLLKALKPEERRSVLPLR